MEVFCYVCYSDVLVIHYYEICNLVRNANLKIWYDGRWTDPQWDCYSDNLKSKRLFGNVQNRDCGNLDNSSNYLTNSRLCWHWRSNAQNSFKSELNRNFSSARSYEWRSEEQFFSCVRDDYFTSKRPIQIVHFSLFWFIFGCTFGSGTDWAVFCLLLFLPQRHYLFSVGF